MDERQVLLARTEQCLLDVERRIGLLSRVSPKNFQLVIEQWIGDDMPRAFVYEQPVDWSLEWTLLETLERELSSLGNDVVVRLLVGRIAELALELRLVEACGSADVARLGAERFSFQPSERESARALAANWLAEPDPDPSKAERGSWPLLASSLSRHPGVIALGCGVVEADIVSLAAVAGGRLLVRRGARASPRDAERIFVHEVGAHLGPRLRAEREGPPFRIGTAGSAQDEEGRAVLLEERNGLLDVARRRELAARCVAAEAALAGADASEILRRLAALGLQDELARRLALRAVRGGGTTGGGLGREVVYLAGYLRVARALGEAPELESWMTRGRISIVGARALGATA